MAKDWREEFGKILDEADAEMAAEELEDQEDKTGGKKEMADTEELTGDPFLLDPDGGEEKPAFDPNEGKEAFDYSGSMGDAESRKEFGKVEIKDLEGRTIEKVTDSPTSTLFSVALMAVGHLGRANLAGQDLKGLGGLVLAL